MQPLTHHEGVVVPLDRVNIDTDALLPKQYLKSLEARGFGGFLLDNERYLDPGELDTPLASRRENPHCVLNVPPYRHASVVLAQANFGCGSSREHAVWALRDFGIRVLLAPSFGDIFYNNCFGNGLLPIRLEQAVVDHLFAQCLGNPGLQASVDVARRELVLGDTRLVFELDAGRQHNLLQGLDDIDQTLALAPLIRAYEARRQRSEPWVFR
ncbi:MAG TPA: 3-isopropylmalate dehydratase small subunit [Rhodanobacter sp.]|jgi:3-isopropylmalate/(R)-2-methylmalate dehydratase small subunit